MRGAVHPLSVDKVGTTFNHFYRRLAVQRADCVVSVLARLFLLRL